MNSSTINLIVSFVFLLFLIIGFFIGFWRGIKKSAVNLAFSLVAVVVAFFITPLIANAILNITVTYNETTVTLDQYLVNMLKENPDIAAMIENNPNIELLVEKLPSVVINIVLFLVVSVLFTLVFYIIYKIIAVTCLKNKEYEKKHRVLGGVIGVVKTFIVVVFVFMPISSLLSLFNDIQYREDIYKDNSANTMALETTNSNEVSNGDEQDKNLSAIGQMLPQEVSEIVSGLNQNFFFQMCGATGLNDALFDYYGSVEINGEKLLIREEISSYAKAYDFSVQISNITSSQHNFSDLNFDVIEPYLNQILDGGFFRQIVVGVLQDFITNYQNYPFLNENQTFQEYLPLIENVSNSLQKLLDEGADKVINYFKNDIKCLFNIFKDLSINGIIDQINSIENVSAKDIIQLLTNEKNTAVLSLSINNLFNMNILRDGLDIVLNKFLPDLIEGVDQIVVDTTDWIEEDWKDLSAELTDVLTSFGEVTKNVDVFEVLNDPTILISNESDINIEETTTALGKFIDKVLAVSILQNAEGESILNKVLLDNNFALPSEEVIKNDNSVMLISNYQEYFAFISQSLVEIKENDLYNALLNSSSANDSIKTLANIISQEGNENLLANIVMPLYQVEPTKTIIVDAMTNSLNSDLVNFSTLSNYEDWKNELNSFSQILKLLNQEYQSGSTYLDAVLNGKFEDLLNNLSETETLTITELLKPVLYAKSTEGLKQEFFTPIQDALNQIVSEENTITLDISSVTFEENNTEDQADEICEIFEQFLNIYKDGNFSFDTIDKIKFGQLLDSMKENAYRQELQLKTEKGLFYDAFDKIYKEMQTQFPKIIDIVGEKPVYEISFESLMKIVDEFENAEVGSFIESVANVIGTSEITIENLSKMLDSITEETNQDNINSFLTLIEGFEVVIEVPQEYKDAVLSDIEGRDILTQTTKDQLKNLLGLNN